MSDDKLLDWDGFFEFVLGISANGMHGLISNDYLAPTSEIIGRDVPASDVEKLCARLLVLRKTKFADFPIKRELSVEELYHAFMMRKRDHEVGYPRDRFFDTWNYYGPYFQAVDDVYLLYQQGEASKEDFRKAICDLFDAKLHD